MQQCRPRDGLADCQATPEYFITALHLSHLDPSHCRSRAFQKFKQFHGFLLERHHPALQRPFCVHQRNLNLCHLANRERRFLDDTIKGDPGKASDKETVGRPWPTSSGHLDHSSSTPNPAEIFPILFAFTCFLSDPFAVQLAQAHQDPTAHMVGFR